MQYFSENLKKERLAHNWTQSELADRARVNVSSITAYEQGRRTPPLDVAHRLAEALGVPLDRLCRDKDAKRETFRTLADVAAGFLLLERKGLVTQVGTHWQGPNPGDPVLYEDEVDPQNPQISPCAAMHWRASLRSWPVCRRWRGRTRAQTYALQSMAGFSRNCPAWTRSPWAHRRTGR